MQKIVFEIISEIISNYMPHDHENVHISKVPPNIHIPFTEMSVSNGASSGSVSLSLHWCSTSVWYKDSRKDGLQYLSYFIFISSKMLMNSQKKHGSRLKQHMEKKFRFYLSPHQHMNSNLTIHQEGIWTFIQPVDMITYTQMAYALILIALGYRRCCIKRATIAWFEWWKEHESIPASM